MPVVLRRPRLAVYVDGAPLPRVLEMTTTRGLDQELATAEIAVPVLPASVRVWSKVQIMVAQDQASAWVIRFTGYVVGMTQGLWPGTEVILCEDVLAIAKHFYPPQPTSLADYTDVQAIQLILGVIGFDPSQLNIIGLGKKLGDIDDAQLFWEEGQSALAAIQQIDSASLGRRTFASAGGMVWRRWITMGPTVEYVKHYEEGVNILEGSASFELVDPKTDVTVEGDGVSATSSVSPSGLAWRSSPFFYRNTYLQYAGSSVEFITVDEVADYLRYHVGKTRRRVQFSTHEDAWFQGAESIRVTSRRLRVAGIFWVQSVQTHVSPAGAFTLTITAVSDFDSAHDGDPFVGNPIGVQLPVNTDTQQAGDVLTADDAQTPAEPSNADIFPDFAIVAIDQELVLIDDVETTIWVVVCEDQSTSAQGTIVTRTWAASGGGAFITSGTGDTFNTAFTDLDAALIELTVEDSNGSTGSIERAPGSAGAGIRVRKLYAAAEDAYEAFDGTQWRTQAPVVPVTVAVVAAGPWWGADSHVTYSPDDLQTPAQEVLVFPGGEDVTALWKHEANEYVAAAGDAGSIAVSHDLGATWELKTALTGGGPVGTIIVSIFDPNEMHAVNSFGWWKSQDEGTTWERVRTADIVYLELAHSRNIVVTGVAAGSELQKAEDGTLFTFGMATPDIVAATAHIREDKFYALADDGTTWYTEESGSFEMVAGEPIPEGTPQPGGTYRDGALVDVVYFATGDGGLWKTIDGFRSAGGYFKLREGVV